MEQLLYQSTCQISPGRRRSCRYPHRTVFFLRQQRHGKIDCLLCLEVELLVSSRGLSLYAQPAAAAASTGERCSREAARFQCGRIVYVLLWSQVNKILYQQDTAITSVSASLYQWYEISSKWPSMTWSAISQHFHWLILDRSCVLKSDYELVH